VKQKLAREKSILKDGVEYHRALCCSPVPGDAVFGFMNRSQELTIHKSSCLNALELQKYPERIVSVGWPQPAIGKPETYAEAYV
jgi:(p)ppGpp synthase/HD superfamily hydrolase